jgi:hypothetical protein
MVQQPTPKAEREVFVIIKPTIRSCETVHYHASLYSASSLVETDKQQLLSMNGFGGGGGNRGPPNKFLPPSLLASN